MRTTLEITDAQRASLLELAARRGEKGFSRLVQEALDLYLREVGRKRARIEAARRVLGTLQGPEAEAFGRTVAGFRGEGR